jgi:hypothetical protein
MSPRLPFLLGAVAATVLFLGWRITLPPPGDVQTAILGDRSESELRLEPCNTVAGVVNAAIDAIGDSRKASLAVLLTGDAASADEPTLVSLPSVPRPSRRAIDGPASNASARAAYLGRVIDECQRAGVATHSPIYQGIARMIEHLRRQGGEHSRRLAWVQSDGEELSEPRIKAALRGRSPTPPANLPRIDNRNIDIVFCGTAQTTGLTQHKNRLMALTTPRSAERAERVRMVWSAVFTDAQRVHFEPFCPRWPTNAPRTDASY